MSDARLLRFGIALVAIAVVGGAMTFGSVSGGSGWMNFMGSPGHMMWSGAGDLGTANAPILDASEVIVEADEFGFSPETITVVENTPVNLTLINTGSIFHDLTIQDVGFRVAANGGERVTGGLVPQTPGTYEFECSISGHAQAGMTGTLIVTADS